MTYKTGKLTPSGGLRQQWTLIRLAGAIIYSSAVMTLKTRTKKALAKYMPLPRLKTVKEVLLIYCLLFYCGSLDSDMISYTRGDRLQSK